MPLQSMRCCPNMITLIPGPDATSLCIFALFSPRRSFHFGFSTSVRMCPYLQQSRRWTPLAPIVLHLQLPFSASRLPCCIILHIRGVRLKFIASRIDPPQRLAPNTTCIGRRDAHIPATPGDQHADLSRLNIRTEPSGRGTARTRAPPQKSS